MAQETQDNEQAAHVRNIKRALVDIHKELMGIKKIPRDQSQYGRGIREIKLADTKVQEGISWLDNAIFGLKSDNGYQPE